MGAPTSLGDGLVASTPSQDRCPITLATTRCGRPFVSDPRLSAANQKSSVGLAAEPRCRLLRSDSRGCVCVHHECATAARVRAAATYGLCCHQIPLVSSRRPPSSRQPPALRASSGAGGKVQSMLCKQQPAQKTRVMTHFDRPVRLGAPFCAPNAHKPAEHHFLHRLEIANHFLLTSLALVCCTHVPGGVRSPCPPSTPLTQTPCPRSPAPKSTARTPVAPSRVRNSTADRRDTSPLF